jgi:uncharacterized protein YcsI (UPF0317 family)
MTAPALLESQRVRQEIRAGRITGTSRGLAHGFVQTNLAILPKDYAFEFLLYCQRNQRACPVLEVTDPGNPVPGKLAPTADLRTDCARYAIYRNGVRVEDRTDIADLWRDDLVSFLIGSGISIDGALENAGVPTHKDRWVLRTTLPTEPAGPFHGNMIVTMRWLTSQQAITATQVTARFPFNHGVPIHLGDPAEIGAEVEKPLFGGPVPPTPKGIVPVIWACGVTPQSAAENAKLPLFIAHAPAHSFITDLPVKTLMSS